jgi:hypothetical protein
MTAPCTCHPDDNPPVPCEARYALTDCRMARATRVVFKEMNRDPGKFYSLEACALAVQFAEALIKAGVIQAPQKEAGE